MTDQGRFANGIEYVTWGDGDRTLLFLQGGPGSSVPTGMLLRRFERLLAPYVDAGFRPWVLTRRRHMPPGHTMADMADDVADAVSRHLDGHVDLVVGESYGGCIALELAAAHPDAVGQVVVVAAASRVTDEGVEIDTRMARGLADRDPRATGDAVAEYLLAGHRLAPLRRLVAPLLGRAMLSSHDCPPEDLLVEAEAERAYDCRAVLPTIRVPVVMVCGERDRFFARTTVEQTAAAIPSCRLLWQPHGHLRTAAGKHTHPGALALLEAQPR